MGFLIHEIFKTWNVRPLFYTKGPKRPCCRGCNSRACPCIKNHTVSYRISPLGALQVSPWYMADPAKKTIQTCFFGWFHAGERHGSPRWEFREVRVGRGTPRQKNNRKKSVWRPKLFFVTLKIFFWRSSWHSDKISFTIIGKTANFTETTQIVQNVVVFPS